MSPIAYKLYQHLRSQPPGQNLVMEELLLTLRASKTAMRSAMVELEAEGLVTIIQES